MENDHEHGTRKDDALEDIHYVSHLAHHLQFVPDYGLWAHSIKEAAELVAVDMWFSGMIDGVDEPEDFDGYSCTPGLIKALEDTITTCEARLSAAVDSGRLKASLVRRGLDEKLILEKTHIEHSDLLKWLLERGHEPGDHITEWEDDEIRIVENLMNDLVYIRLASRDGTKEFWSATLLQSIANTGILDESAKKLIEAKMALQAKDIKIDRLKEELALLQSGRPAKVDRPLHTRQRRTLLTIIAALCKTAKIDYTKRGASQRIKNITELFGAPVDDGTIIKMLEEIPDAVETRMK